MTYRMSEDGISDGVPGFVRALARKGVKLWECDGNLHYRILADALTQAEMDTLRANKIKIVNLLREAKSVEGSGINSLPGPVSGIAPLSFSQTTHWNMYGLEMLPSVCLVCCTLQISGDLDLALLRKSIEALVGRHDALRTRILLVDSEPMQRVVSEMEFDLRVHDLTTLTDESRTDESARLIKDYQLEPANVLSDGLFKVRILRIAAQKYVLILSMEHIIADGFSLEIFLRELFFIYSRLSAEKPLSLPAITIQFPAYARWQRETHCTWLARHGQYWTEHLLGCDRLMFPSDFPRQPRVSGDWGLVTFEIDASLKSRMREWCKAHATTTVMYALAVYAVLVLRWCGAQETVILCENDGRNDPETRNTIGYFAFPLYLRLHASRGDRFVDILQRTIAEYCSALAHADHSYFESLAARPAFTRNTCFNWLPQTASVETPLSSGAEGPFTVERLPFEHRKVSNFHKDIEPTLGVTELEHHALGWIQFPLSWFREATMERFAASYISLIEQALDRPNMYFEEFKCA